MANSIDFRSDQIQTSKIIVTGSNPEKKLLVYGIAADDSPHNQGNINTAIFPTTAIGSDVFLFVSGGVGKRGGLESAISAFGGDLHASGAISTDSIVKSQYLSASLGGIISGSFVQGFQNLADSDVSHAEGSKTGTGTRGFEVTSVTTGVFKLHKRYNNVTSIFSGGVIIVYNDGLQRSYLVDSTSWDGTNTFITVLDTNANGTSISIAGNNTNALADIIINTGDAGHAEGLSSYALGSAAHAEGLGTVAFGTGSHAEGWLTVAIGTGSHASGIGTIAFGSIDGVGFLPSVVQTVIGKYNIADSNTTSSFVIGNGTDNENRSDIFKVDTSSVQITGSLHVDLISGITGSIRYINNAKDAFIVPAGGSTITTNYNSSTGQWEIGGGGGGQTILYASDATTDNGIGLGGASIIGSGPSSLINLASAGGSTFTYTSTAMQSPSATWTLPSDARKVTMYGRIDYTSNFTTGGFRYIMAAMRYAGESLPASALFGMSVNDNDTVYSGDKRTGSNAGVSVGTVGVGVFRLSAVDSWFRVIWDLEAGLCTYSFGTGISGAKPVYWKLLTTSRVSGDNNSTLWPMGSNAQIVLLFDSYNSDASKPSINIYSELVIN